MRIPNSVYEFALKHKINLGRNEHYYFVRDPVTLREVAFTVTAKPTAANAIAMMRRHLRSRSN